MEAMDAGVVSSQPHLKTSNTLKLKGFSIIDIYQFIISENNKTGCSHKYLN